MFAVVVVGMPKSGTSALYAAIKQTGDWLSIYETSNPRQFDYLATSRAPRILTKVLTQKAVEIGFDLSFFDRQVFIVRDPRDVVISWLMFRPFLHGNYWNEAFIEDLAFILRAKEEDPPSVPLSTIYDVFAKHGVPLTRHRDYRTAFRAEIGLWKSAPRAFVQRYEDFVDGRLDDLSAYLGLDLQPDAKLGSHISFNERSKSYGGWRNWFTPKDVAIFRPLFEDYLSRHGYDVAWDLAEHPVIGPETSSEHLLRNAARLRESPESSGELRHPELYTGQYIRLLESAVSDGREPAIVELGLAYLMGYGVDPNTHTGLRLLRDAAMRGSSKALVHMGMAYRHGVGVPHSETAAKSYFLRSAALRGNAPTKSMMGRVNGFWEEL